MIHSLVMTVRTVIMLACMIILPLAAVFWPTISDRMRVWLADIQSRPRSTSPTVAPPYPAAVAPASEPPPTWNAAGPAPPAPAQPAPPGADSATTDSSPPSAPLRQPVRNMSEWSKQSRQEPAPAPVVEQWGSGGAPALAGPLVPMSATPADLAASRVQQAGVTHIEPAPPSDVGSSALPRAEHAQVHEALIRLRELGANYYRLETDGRQYHFSCDMAIAPESNREKRFTAAADQPFEAVRQVLAEIEAWRGQGR